VERLALSASGTTLTQNNYLRVNRVFIDSGFTGLSGAVEGSLSIIPSNPPVAWAPYFANYSYTAPTEGERISIRYRHNRLLSDLLFLLEEQRPITADVLLKAAEPLAVDIIANIVVAPAFTNNSSNVEQEVQESLVSFLTGNGLNTVLDQSDIINAMYGVPGVDRVIITRFNTAGLTGVVKTITANRTQYITAGQILINTESR
jgi:hypothetical protein